MHIYRPNLLYRAYIKTLLLGGKEHYMIMKEKYESLAGRNVNGPHSL
jgi:hypothetical protein